jgi:hypothetical protein
VSLFEIGEGNSLVPFRQLRGGAELYERELEQLLWDNIDDFTGEPLFRVARQPVIGTGGRPDIVALDASAHAVVIEVKRDVDRGQLAQCLEYAGWARSSNLDELARLYHLGPERFFPDWQEFTESDIPAVISRPPRLILVAREFHGRTGSAFEFLAENGLPVGLIEVSLYEDQQGRRFVDVGIEGAETTAEEVSTPAGGRRRSHTTLGGRRVRVSDLLDAGLLQPDEELTWERPRLGQRYTAVVRANGSIELPDGRSYSSPSTAACEAAGIAAYDGWFGWAAHGVALKDLRAQAVDLATEEPGEADSGNAVESGPTAGSSEQARATTT